MRGATAPRLILELICGRILLPIGDASESGLLARIERLERVGNIAQGPDTASNSLRSHTPLSQPSSQSDSKPVKDVDPADYVSPATAEAKREVPVAAKPPVKPNDVDGAKVVSEASSFASQASEAPQSAPLKKVENMDVAGLRRLWPDVIENVKKRRRLTWSLLSASAQILGVDDKNITIGIVNPGARDSFIRSESDEILRQAFIEVVGLDRKIEVTVDPSIDTTSTPEARAVRTSEAPTDKTQLTGAALLAAELGATVISETSHE
jgi:DNA polymerase-3 subunit gamma/tau